MQSALALEEIMHRKLQEFPGDLFHFKINVRRNQRFNS